MSTETLTGIMDETSARLASASHGAETHAVGIEHMAKLGSDLAETLFTLFGDGSFSDAQINAAILENLEKLRRSVLESFAAFGITEGAYLDQCLATSASGFLDRGETLFSIYIEGGAA